MKKVFIRADSSESIGTGHIMRCLTLAKEFARSKGVSVEFISRTSPGDITFVIEEQGFKVNRIEPKGEYTDTQDSEQSLQILNAAGPSLLVIDNYEITDVWIKRVRADNAGLFILAIDDLADRFLSVDALLNQNHLPDIENKYQSLVPQKCRLFLGPMYALLRDEFHQTKRQFENQPLKQKQQGSSIFVFFGGTDPSGETLKVLPALDALSNVSVIDIVTGANNQHNEKIRKQVAPNRRINFYSQVSNISHYMAKAELAIGAGGSTCLERMFFGLPSVTVITAENQLEATEFYQAEGLIKNLGWHHSVSLQDIYTACTELMSHPEKADAYKANMQKIAVGSRGAVYVVSELMRSFP